MKITRLESCDPMPVTMAGVKDAVKQVPLGKADGAPNFSIRVFTIQPGGHTPHHSHDSEHLNYILEGSGEVLDGDQPRAIKPGTTPARIRKAVPEGTVQSAWPEKCWINALMISTDQWTMYRASPPATTFQFFLLISLM